MTTVRDVVAAMARILRELPEDLAVDALGRLLVENGEQAIRVYLCEVAGKIEHGGVPGAELPAPATGDEVVAWLRVLESRVHGDLATWAESAAMVVKE